MSEIKSSLAENFSFMHGSARNWLPGRRGHAGDNRFQFFRRAWLAVLISWLPLFVLSLLQGEAYGTQIRIPFLQDLAVNVRFLIAVPILILAELEIDQRLRALVLEFLKSGLVAEKELPSFETVIEKTARLRDRALAKFLLIVGALAPSIFFRTEVLMGNASNWHYAAGGTGGLSLAGWWFSLVSAPLFRFLLLRWLWRMFLWSSFLWRVSKINLYLIATHADFSAGLGFLSMGQMAFSPIVFAGGAVIAAQVGNTIAYQGASLSSQKFPMIAYGVIAIITLVAPLLLVSPVLFRVKQKALLEYGALVTVHNQQFDQKWIQEQKPSDEVILGNPDPSSLIDLGSSYIVVRQMTLVPIDRRTLISLAMAALSPMVPVILLATPADQLVRAVLRMLG